MYPEHGFSLLFLAIVVFLFVRAYRNGVIGLLSGSIGIAGGILAGWAFYLSLESLIPSLESFRAKLMVSFAVGVVAWLVVRLLARVLIRRLFNPEGPLSAAAEGPIGGLLSLIPALVTIFVLIFAVRVFGTWSELRRYEAISIPGVELLEKDYPLHPRSAGWRDGIEKLPFVTGVFHPIDRFSRVPERNLVALLITSKKEELFNHLNRDPESQPIVKSDAFAALLINAEIGELNEARKHVDLLLHEKIGDAALDEEIRKSLEGLELQRLADEFMLSPERQSLIESYGDRGTQ